MMLLFDLRNNNEQESIRVPNFYRIILNGKMKYVSSLKTIKYRKYVRFVILYVTLNITLYTLYARVNTRR